MSVSRVFTEELSEVKTTFGIPIIGKMILRAARAGVLSGSDEEKQALVLEWRRVAAKFGFGAETVPSLRSYREYWQRFLDEVAAAVA